MGGCDSHPPNYYSLYRKDTLCMDACLFYLNEAEDQINSIIDISIAESVFSDIYDTEETNNFNEGVITGAINSLKSAVKVLKEAIQKIINSITDFFKNRGLSAEERAKFNEIRKWAANNPEFANQKVTIANYKEYEKVYDDALKQMNSLFGRLKSTAKNAVKSAADPVWDAIQGSLDAILGKVEKDINSIANEGAGMVKRGSLTVTMKTALEMADSNAAAAKALKLALNDESSLLESIEKELGKKEAEKFSKKLEAYARNGRIHRAKVKLLGRKNKTLQSIARKQYKAILSFTNLNSDGTLKNGKGLVDGGSIARGFAKNPGLAKNTVKGMNVGDIIDVVKDVNSAKKTVKSAKKSASDIVDDVKSFFDIKKNKK